MSAQQILTFAIQHHQAGRLAEAEALYRQILAAEPRHVDAMELLGVLAYQSGHHDVAIDLIRQAIALAPRVAAFHSNLGLALAGKRQWDEAIAAYRQAIALQPDFARAHHNLGIALYERGDADQAVAAYRQAIALEPGLAEAHGNLGVVLCVTDELDQGIAAIRRAIGLQPGYAEAWNNLGTALKETGPLQDVIAAHRQAIALRPDLAEAHSNLMLALHYDPSVDVRTIAEEHDRWQRQHGEPLRQFIRVHANDHDPHRRLRIGYVSADFREHAVAMFVEDLLASQDAAQVESFCYANVARPDAVTARLRGLAAHWRDIYRRSDAEAADLIRQDQIDILVDLGGHTAGNRLTLFARQPAPVQVTWLGYPDSTGLRTIDYRFTDALADPPGITDELHSEELIRLSPCAWSFRPSSEAPPVNPLPALTARQITFGCFSTLLKINEPLLDMWCEILQGVPGSRLSLKNRGLRDRATEERLRRRFQAAGIPRERLTLVAATPDLAGHLDFYHQVDIALDTFPYHGTATTCEALWMGVPVVTLAGHTSASRAGVSLLTNVGFPELIAHSPTEYQRLAVTLAGDLPRLTELRRTLRGRMESSVLMDAPHFARGIESAYRVMWQRWCLAKAGP